MVFDRTRQINRLRAQLLEIFPTLEWALDLTKKGPITLTGYQTPAAIRRMDPKRLETCLRKRRVTGATGGELSAFDSPDGFAGLAPSSGTSTGPAATCAGPGATTAASNGPGTRPRR